MKKLIIILGLFTLQAQDIQAVKDTTHYSDGAGNTIMVIADKKAELTPEQFLAQIAESAMAKDKETGTAIKIVSALVLTYLIIDKVYDYKEAKFYKDTN